MTVNREALPLAPLLHAYLQPGLIPLAGLANLPVLGPRFAAVLPPAAPFFRGDFLDRAGEGEWLDALERFYKAVVAYPLHLETVRQRAGFIRHAVAHVLRGDGSVAQRLEACLSPSGVYHVPGLGPSFWSAIAQGLNPGRHPAWTGATVAAARRLKLLPSTPGTGYAATYAALSEAYGRMRALQPQLLALHLDHFLSLVAHMPARNLWQAVDALSDCPVRRCAGVIRRQVRERLKERGAQIALGQELLQAGLQAQDGKKLGDALALADPIGSARCPIDWGLAGETLALWIGRLWEADDPYDLLQRFWAADPLSGAGLWLPAAVLHLRDPQAFAPFNDTSRRGLAVIDDSVEAALPPEVSYRHFNEAVATLREQHQLSPVLLPNLLGEMGGDGVAVAPGQGSLSPGSAFRGFCADTFRFLDELSSNNRATWMNAQRGRYRFAVRTPMTELCRQLAARYVEPILCRGHGWEMETEATKGKALTSICKNVFGRSAPYAPVVWIAFCRKGRERADAQLFVRLDASGVRFGLRLDRSARATRQHLRSAIDHDAEGLFQALSERGALRSCNFGPADQPQALGTLQGIEGLRAWAAGGSLEASRFVPAGDALATSDELAGEILLVFDQLFPLVTAALEAAPTTTPQPRKSYAEGDFFRETFLDVAWLSRARELLHLKGQLILQGVPGTGKTHVARCLARLLAGDRPEAVQLVQFHPAYSYEEFVEGIKVRTINIEGRNEVTYPVEEGLLCRFATRAATNPSLSHVLIIDELNRGNLPRIFGELLYLLEYRGQAVELPCSRRAFSLPANLYLVATMNAADRSVVHLDQALRRRFSFIEMAPDGEVLERWLREHEPTMALRVLGLFEKLNARLKTDAGVQVGHSHFMVRDLDERRLRVIWQHHIRPLLDEVFASQPGRAATYEALLEGSTRGRRESVTV